MPLPQGQLTDPTTAVPRHSRLLRFLHYHLIIPKILYFLSACIIYAPSLFFAQYLKEKWRIPEEDYGLVTLPTVFMAVGVVFWTNLADRFGCIENILIVKTTLYLIIYLGYFLLEGYVDQWSARTRIIAAGLLYGISGFFNAAIFPLIGTRVLGILASNTGRWSKNILGQQKVWNTLGIAFINYLNGALTDRIGYTAQFLLTGIFSFLFCVILAFSSNQTRVIRTDKEAISSRPTLSRSKSMKKMFQKSDLLLAILIFLIVGFVRNTFVFYFGGFMEAILGKGNKGYIGLMTISRIFPEIFLFQFSDRLLPLIGCFGFLKISLIASFVRSVLYAVLPATPEAARYAFLIELLKGISHSGVVIGGCILMSDLAPTSLQAFGQGIFTCTHGYLSASVGGLLMNIVLKYRMEDGRLACYRRLFGFAGGLAGLGFLILLVRLLKRK